MVAMDLPPEFTELRILAQRDRRMTPDGKTVQLSPARHLLAKVIRRFEGEGRKVFLWAPPTYAKDINEFIQHKAVMTRRGKPCQKTKCTTSNFRQRTLSTSKIIGASIGLKRTIMGVATAAVVRRMAAVAS
jgi:hypothetical protein